MLRFLSKQQRARNILLVFLSFLLALTLFVFLGLPAGRWFSQAIDSTGVLDPDTPVAEVDGEEIPLGELQRALARFTQSSPGAQSFSFIKSFSDEMLDQLIERRIKERVARRLKITVTDEEVAQQIARLYPGFLDEKGRFVSFDRYRAALERSGLKVTEFENDIRASLLDEKLRSYITAGVTVTPQEIERAYVRQNTSVDVVYLILDPRDLEDEVDVSEEEARQYFNEHRDEFEITETERKVDYLFIPYEPLQKTVKVTDDEIKREYERTKNQYTVGAWASQIVFPFNETNEAAVRQKADAIVKRARGGENKPPEDFAALGGKRIGYVKKDPKDTSYRQRIFFLRDDQKNVTDPIREDDAFYVLKVHRWKRKSLATVRRELVRRLRERKARTEANRLAQEIKKRLDETKDLQKVAEEFRQQLGNPPLDQLVRHTGFFAPSDRLPEFGTYSASFTSACANLNEIGEVGNRIFLKDGLAIPQLRAKREPHKPEFDEVKDRVIARLRSEKAERVARQRAQQIIDRAHTVSALRRLARARRWDLKTQRDFKRGSILSDLQHSEQLEGFAFRLAPNHVAPQPLKVGDKFVVLGVTGRREADLTKLAEQEDDLRQQLLNQRRAQFYQAYLERIKDRLASEGRIIIYKDVFDTFTATGGADIRKLLNVTPAP